MFRNKSVNVHQFAMTPRADVPRSAFRMQKVLKTAFDSGYLVPIFCEEAYPADKISLRLTCFARLATPLTPFLDNLHLETFFFFVPNRLVWTNWVKFMGEQDNPADSISFSIPQMVSPAGGYAIGSLQDYFGLPTVGQVVGGNTVTHSALPLRMYSLIWNSWFRDQNLQNSVTVDKGDAASTYSNYVLLRRGKRHDYFTSCLPWPLKGGVEVSMPLGSSAPIKVNAAAGSVLSVKDNTNTDRPIEATGLNTAISIKNAAGSNPMFADLSSATAATINQIRTAIQTQRWLERQARSGTRYPELIEGAFGVRPPDYRLSRPEYIGGGSSPVTVNPIAQTTATGLTGGSTPLGNLAAMGTALAHGHGFSYSVTEHGYFIGLVSVRADLTYQQGLRRHWSRTLRPEFYDPVFAHLGEQAVLNREIYCDGSANDAAVFGYQERWGELRYNPSEITGLMRSTAASTIDKWHLAQKFASLPSLNTTFVQDTPPVDRVLAVGAGANGQQLIADFFFDVKAARPLPMYSVPGLMDHL